MSSQAPEAYKPSFLGTSFWSHENVNDRIEPTFKAVERFLNKFGRYWPVAIITAALRVFYGGCEALFGLGLAFFKLIETNYKLIRYDATHAELPLAECKAALSYMAHGAANIFRGGLEALGIMTIWALCNRRSFASARIPYACEASQFRESLLLAELDGDATDLEPLTPASSFQLGLRPGDDLDDAGSSVIRRETTIQDL